jgi:hypothetical protein
MKTAKAKALRIHTKRRAYARLGIVLTDQDLNGIVRDIQKGRGTCLEKQSNRRSVWEVKVKDRLCRVVYDKYRKTIITLLKT